MTKQNLNNVFREEKVSLIDNKFIRWSEDDAGIGMELIGVRDGKLVFVGTYNWQIYEIDYNSIEHKGKLMGCNLRDVKENPDIILTDAKYMTIEELEKELGYKVILK